jgi:hypothetical protein
MHGGDACNTYAEHLCAPPSLMGLGCVHDSSPFPDLNVFKQVLYPSVYLPLFMTSAKRALMFSWFFFCAYSTKAPQQAHRL